jgi:hypothetical protein
MPSIATTDGYTFINWGPLTTTFTAPPVALLLLEIICMDLTTQLLSGEYAVQCSTVGYGNCIPTGTVSLSTISIENPTTLETQAYFSTGLYCPVPRFRQRIQFFGHPKSQYDGFDANFHTLVGKPNNLIDEFLKPE